ncbi:MAG: hypothetical protein K6343_05360 [Caldisericaceae bacterium]
MENKNKIKQTLKQKFLPYLILRSRVFALPNIEINKFIDDLIQNNPFVDEDDVVVYDEFDWVIDEVEDNLYDFLKVQVDASPIPEDIKEVSSLIIDYLNEFGFLSAPKEEIMQKLGVKKRIFEKALKFVQSLDPPGVGAEDVKECLIIQLESDGNLSNLEKNIILDFFDELLKEDFKPILKKFKVKVDFIKSLREKLLNLDVCPGSKFKNPHFIRHLPDVVIEEDGGVYRASINNASRRKVLLIESYAKVLNKLENKLTKEEFENLLDEARWSLSIIEERDKLLENICNRIASLNTEYFKTGDGLKKFSLEEFASDTFDYSSLSRLIQNKYILTPRGLFPLRYFFKHKNEKFDEEAILSKLKEIIDNEDKTNPLTDEEIGKIFKQMGIDIKRRTIVKYRLKLKIPNSNKRKSG